MSARWFQGRKSRVFLVAMRIFGMVHLAMILAPVAADAVR